MLCEECGKNEAAVQIHMIAPDGSGTDRMLCSECVNKLRAGRNGIRALDVTGFISELINMPQSSRRARETETYEGTCAVCGSSWDDIRKTGCVGCPECYKEFHEPIEEALVRGNGTAVYTGRDPDGGEGVNAEIYKLKKLREQLAKAIGEEDYESAALIRDSIRELEGRQA